MYTIKGKYYSDAGKILIISENGRIVRISYDFTPIDGKELTVAESNVNLDTLKKNGISMVCELDNGKELTMGFFPKRDYSEWKTAIIKWRYTNDDQLAIILNKDESDDDTLRYKRMQEWRDWAATLAKKIIEIM